MTPQYDTISKVKISSKNKNTLEEIFKSPTSANVDWTDFTALILALGGEIEKGGKTGGSRRRVRLYGHKAVFHKPHPGRYMVKQRGKR